MKTLINAVNQSTKEILNQKKLLVFLVKQHWVKKNNGIKIMMHKQRVEEKTHTYITYLGMMAIVQRVGNKGEHFLWYIFIRERQLCIFSDVIIMAVYFNKVGESKFQDWKTQFYYCVLHIW